MEHLDLNDEELSELSDDIELIKLLDGYIDNNKQNKEKKKNK